MSEGPEARAIPANGEQANPAAAARKRWEPTAWTRPLRYAAVIYLGVAVLQWLLTSALFLNTGNQERATRAQNPNLTADQLQAAASFAIRLGWLATVVIVILMLGLAVGSLGGWRWAFWCVLGWMALSSIGVITNTLALMDPASVAEPPGAVAFSLAWAAAALVLGACCVLAALIYGPWAMRRA